MENENGDEKKDDEKESENEKEEITVEVNTKEWLAKNRLCSFLLVLFFVFLNKYLHET